MPLCPQCGSSFIATKRRTKFCSTSCVALFNLSKLPPKRNKYTAEEKKRVCKQCEKIYYCFPSLKSSFCSRICQFEWMKTHPIKYWLGKKRPGAVERMRRTMTGRKHTEEWKRMMSLRQKGKVITVEQRKKISQTLRGHPPNPGSGIGKSGFREDLPFYARSRWEANVARSLEYEELKYVYEPIVVDFGEWSYRPDFYIPELNWFIEVKGYMTDRAREKVEAFRSYAFEQGFAFSLIEQKEYRELSEIYSTVIPEWEA